jgi:hypothetical protein
VNTSRLAELVTKLLEDDRRFSLQTTLEQLASALDNLTNTPNHPDFQQQVSSGMHQLRLNLQSLDESLTPAQFEDIAAMGVTPYFTTALPGGLEALLSSNGITPAVVRDRANELVQQRRQLLTDLTAILAGLARLGQVEATTNVAVELGFLLPRAMFDNTLPGLADQFKEISRILDTFLEVTTGEPGSIELRQLSTTDPWVLVSMATSGAIAFAQTVDWILAKVKAGLEIKELAERSKASFSPGLVEQMRAEIQASVKAALEEHAQGVLSQTPITDEGRRNELGNQLGWAMRTAYSKIEQGMVVELRLPPPDAFMVAATDKTAAEREQAYADLSALSHRLQFPKLTGEPLIPIEPPPPAND